MSKWDRAIYCFQVPTVDINILWDSHRIRIHRRATRVGAFEVFEAAHVALRTLLAFSQPVNCIFWPIGMLNWLVAASKLHKDRVTCCTAELSGPSMFSYSMG